MVFPGEINISSLLLYRCFFFQDSGKNSVQKGAKISSYSFLDLTGHHISEMEFLLFIYYKTAHFFIYRDNDPLQMSPSSKYWVVEYYRLLVAFIATG